MLSRFAQKSFGRTSQLLTQPRRFKANITKECTDHLAALGITNKNIVFNPS